MAEPWTLVQAQEQLAAWLAASLAASSGQSYTIGSRTLTRADVDDIMRMIAFWRSAVDRLTAGRTAGIRLMRAVPRDL